VLFLEDRGDIPIVADIGPVPLHLAGFAQEIVACAGLTSMMPSSAALPTMIATALSNASAASSSNRQVLHIASEEQRALSLSCANGARSPHRLLWPRRPKTLA
jgi:hypothetical protein